MGGIFGLVESASGARLSEWGLQAALLGGVALFLGALRLYVARRTRWRGVLLAGMFLFAAGGMLRSLEQLGKWHLDYYPGWKADFEEVLLEDHAEMEFSDDDLPGGDPRPAWWEGWIWWGQRLGLMAGAAAGAAGFMMVAGWEQRSAAGRGTGAGRREARSR